MWLSSFGVSIMPGLDLYWAGQRFHWFALLLLQLLAPALLSTKGWLVGGTKVDLTLAPLAALLHHAQAPQEVGSCV